MIMRNLVHRILLALQYHPDKNKDPKAEEQFRAIAEAYDILGNAEKRRQYDAQGHDSFTSSSNNQDGFSGFHFNMNDFFRQFDEASARFHSSQHEAHHNAHYKNHEKAHQRAHQQAHQNHFHFDFGSLFDDLDDPFGSIFNPDGSSESVFTREFTHNGGNTHVHQTTSSKQTVKQQTCRTVTRRQGNMVSTTTECH